MNTFLAAVGMVVVGIVGVFGVLVLLELFAIAFEIDIDEEDE